MARTAIAVSTLLRTAGLTATPATITTDGGSIDTSGKVADRLILYIYGTNAANITIPYGDEPPAFRSGASSVTFAVAISTHEMVAFEPARHMQSDGTIYVDTSATVSCEAYYLPNN